MNATIDPDLVKTVQQDVNALKNDVDKMAFEEEVNRENVKKALHDCQLVLEELRERIAIVEHEQEVIKQDQRSLCEKVNHTEEQISELKSEQEDVQQRVAYLGEHLGKQVAIAVREQDIIKQEQQDIRQDQSSLCGKVNTAHGQICELKSEQEDVQRRVTSLEDQQKSNQPQINYGNLNNFPCTVISLWEQNKPVLYQVTKNMSQSNKMTFLYMDSCIRIIFILV